MLVSSQRFPCIFLSFNRLSWFFFLSFSFSPFLPYVIFLSSHCLLQECAAHMIESGRSEKVRHALSLLLVQVLTPVAAVIKYEASMPVVKKLVHTLYTYCYDHARRQRHSAVRPYGLSTNCYWWWLFFFSECLLTSVCTCCWAFSKLLNDNMTCVLGI